MSAARATTLGTLSSQCCFGLRLTARGSLPTPIILRFMHLPLKVVPLGHAPFILRRYVIFKIPRQSYTAEFKREAVTLQNPEGRIVANAGSVIDEAVLSRDSADRGIDRAKRGVPAAWLVRWYER